MSVEKPESRSEQSTSEFAARIRKLIAADRIRDARAALQEICDERLDDPELQRLCEVLKLPVGRLRTITDADRSAEFEWIVANRDSYRGRWVAVDGNRLLADAPTFAELQNRIKDLGKIPLVHRFDS